MLKSQSETKRIRKRLDLLRAFEMDSASRFEGYDLGKNLLGSQDKAQLIRDYKYQLLCLHKIKSYVDAVEHRFADIREIAGEESTKHIVDEINQTGKMHLSPLAYLLFFDPRIDEELFTIAPLAFAALIKGYISNYYDSIPTTIEEDKKEMTKILVEGYGFCKKEARQLRNRIYEYIPRALMISGFFNRIGEHKIIADDSFADDYNQALILQKEIVKKLSKRLTEKLREFGAPMHAEHGGAFDQFKQLLRL